MVLRDESDEQVLAAVLPTVPQLAAHSRAALKISRLGGLTNLVYRVETPGKEAFCLRVPGRGTESFIDRAAERANVTAAAAAGVAPAVLHYGEDGVMLMPLLAGTTMSPAAFSSIDGVAARAGAALKRLHTHERTAFQGRFELFDQIDKYLGELGSDAKLPDGYEETLQTAQGVRAALAARPLPSAPCHCDPLCENFIDDAEAGRMWIIDFEYGGMNDPMWDLGDLSVEAGLDAAREEELLEGYFSGTPPSASERGRYVIYKAMCDLLWTLWGLLQHKNGNPVEDFWAYSLERFERCKKLMATPDFGAHVQAVARGAK
jgi:thiamine kinase-like enzyme